VADRELVALAPDAVGEAMHLVDFFVQNRLEHLGPRRLEALNDVRCRRTTDPGLLPSGIELPLADGRG
jgi:hypothetical protein